MLLAIGLLIAFSVTRVIFIPQGDLVLYAALTLASMIDHRLPGTIWLLDCLCAAALVQSALTGRFGRGGRVGLSERVGLRGRFGGPPTYGLAPRC